ncbi:MAG: AMP-binding protein, partial [Pseudomonadota bacterium]
MAASLGDLSYGHLRDAVHEQEQRERAIADPGAYHGDVAASELHWYCPEEQCWVTRAPESGDWSGYAIESGDRVAPPALTASWRPWQRAFDDRDAPFYRWFQGALTNACFNEVDRHVLAGHGDRTSFIFEGDRWDPSKADGKGGPVFEAHISYRTLLIETVLRAEVLSALGVSKGDRVAFNLPNIPEQLFYTEAAKRLGAIYTPVFGGFSAKTLSDRICDAGARVVVTADGGYRNAEMVGYKESYCDQALDNFLPRNTALAALERVLAQYDQGGLAQRLTSQAAAALVGEITLERGDVMRELGRALAAEPEMAAERSAEIRTAVARELAAETHTVEHVVVCRYTGQDIVKHARDRWSHEQTERALEAILERARAAGFEVRDRTELEALPPAVLWRALCASHPPTAVDPDWPMFIIYTSGSTGKPKGVVHVHGGWLSGVTHSLRMIFDAKPEDRLWVVADPGWITGQAYMIAAPLALGMTSLVAEGSPLFPHAGRFSSIIERHKVTLFKAGSTFLKSVMTDPASTADMAAHDMSGLKAATFCAEPVSPSVQEFAMAQVCERYINSYWATEHGGMVFSCPWGDFKPLAPDAKTWAMPWVDAQVRIAEETDADGRATRWRPAEVGEKGELVIARPYAYLARTLWGDVARLGQPEWQGDIERFKSVYFDRWSDGLAYTQGDYARGHEGGGFTLHGRSDDVINASGHRIGTEEIEGAILRDKTLRKDSPLGNVVVVGAPHEEKGETPVAFLIPAPGSRLQDDDLARLAGLVRTEKGATAVPSDFLIVNAFPETRSGKYMRRTLRALLLEEPLGDLSTLRNPEIVEEIRETVARWKAFGQLSEARQIVQSYRYLRVENHFLRPSQQVSIVTINSPPVNALSERTLDELHTVIGHLAKQDATVAVVITGAGNAFVAGADVKELLEVGEAGDLSSAQTPPNAAHTAFSGIENLGKPVIAAVNGPALGGGNELVLTCSYVLAASDARFGQPEINLNLLPGYGGTQRLPRRLHQRGGEPGLSSALRMLLDGRAISADDALALGLVDAIVPAREAGVVERAVALVRAYLDGEGPLPAAQVRWQEALAQRERPLPIIRETYAEPALAAAILQLRHSGRSASVNRIIEATLHGAAHGQQAGLAFEAEQFAQAVCDPDSGPKGIKAFLEKRSAPLPVKRAAIAPDANEATRAALEAEGRLLPLNASFYPGITPVPQYQYGMGVDKDPATGLPRHGDPKDSERLLVFPTPRPAANEALVYILASEVNFNDIWALTGIPVSPFDVRDNDDLQVTGSGGIGLIARLGDSLLQEGRLSVGQLVTIYSGQSELVSPDQGLDPMAANFHIQGYEVNDGSHAQFLTVQGPQLHPKLAGLTIEEAGSYGLTLGTIHRALFNTLDVESGKRLFVEGASTGTGLECLRSARQSGLDVVGMVSAEDRAERVRSHGGIPVNRKDPRWADVFQPVPDDPERWAAWEAAGQPFVDSVHQDAGGAMDYVVSHAGEQA